MKKMVQFDKPVRFVKVFALGVEHLVAVHDDAKLQETLKYLRDDCNVLIDVEELEVLSEDEIAEAVSPSDR